jgi:hypothetical protein
MKMKKRLLMIVTMATIISVWTMGIAMAEKMPKGIELGETVVMAAEVVAIDKTDRTITLLGSEGNIVDLEVGKEARNFNQIKVGDMLKVEYYMSVATYIGKKGTQPDAEAGIVVGRSAKGEKPGAFITEVIDISATVKSINKSKRTLKLEMPGGKVVETTVDKSIKVFDSLKKGDAIHVRLTEAVAILIETPEG